MNLFGYIPCRLQCAVDSRRSPSDGCPPRSETSAAGRDTSQRAATAKAVRAFSLVEVVLALGIASFCLLVMLGLLPTGLLAAKNTREQTAAANLVETISTGIRNASTNSSGDYAVAGVCTNLTWSLGGGEVGTNAYFTLGGVPNATATESQLIAQIEVVPPTSTNSSGTAMISVAWPQQAQWQASVSAWSNAAGHVDSWLVFEPQQ